MPVKSCKKDGKPGFKWGDAGFCYTYTPGSEAGRNRAKQQATAQGLAIGDIDKFLDDCLCSDIGKAKIPEWIRVQIKAEKVLAARMMAGYRFKANKAVKRAASMAGNGFTDTEIVRVVNAQMKIIFSENQIKRFNKDIVRYFKSDRQIAANDFKIEVADNIDAVALKGQIIHKADSDLDIAFDLKDQEIVKLILAQNLIAAQNLYKAGLSGHVVSVIRSIMRNTGLSNADQKKLITSEMSKALGLKKGDIKGLEKTVPPKFRGDAKDYYTGLAQTTLTRAQVMGRINLFSQGTFEKYMFAAIIDTRTSKVCVQMDGRIFTIAQGVEQMDKVLGAVSSDELKKVAGWQKDLSAFGVKDDDDFKRGPLSAKVSKSIADAGLNLPPLHFRCRSTIRPV